MINLHYIRAAIQQNTGVRLSLEETRAVLVEEGLITQRQSDELLKLFQECSQFYSEAVVGWTCEALDTAGGLPDD